MKHMKSAAAHLGLLLCGGAAVWILLGAAIYRTPVMLPAAVVLWLLARRAAAAVSRQDAEKQ
jgi:hypothetical protein